MSTTTMWLAPSEGIAALSDVIDVSLQIVDERGAAVPYATVWGYLLPRASPLAIDASDLRRLAQRYRSSSEFALQVGNLRPVPYLIVYPMADRSGLFRQKVDYRQKEGSAAKRPPKLSIGFAVIKRGYVPAYIDFSVGDESRLAAKVVLKADAEQAVESRPYILEFESLRYELSDPSRNEDISVENYERTQRLRSELEGVAQEAVKSGDGRAAARIYARMQYLPAIRFISGKPAGFTQADPSSEQSLSYLNKAFSLDPDNAYIAAVHLFHEGAVNFGGNKYVSERATPQQRQAFEEYLERLQRLMRAHGPEIWPAYHHLYALWHRKSRDPKMRDRVIPLLEELYRTEPKLQTQEDLLRLPP